MRIAVVNDMPMAVEGLRRLIEGTGIHQVAWVAYGGDEAVQSCFRDVPDLILMDILMPGMSGVDTTRKIMQESPCPILLVTSSIDANSALVFEAMGYGALDAINTPVLSGSNTPSSQEPLLKKISMLSILTNSGSMGDLHYGNSTASQNNSYDQGPLVVVGSSSGGPQALATILQKIPADFHSSIVIIQHVDEQFASGMAEWLNTLSNMPVCLARNGTSPRAGTIYLAASNDHLVMTKDGSFHYSSKPCDTPYRPSVDVFWQSVEQHWKGSITAVLLTGMGRDGAQSMLRLRQSGAYTIAQDQESCAVFGMPKAAIELGAVIDILPIDSIADSILKNTN